MGVSMSASGKLCQKLSTHVIIPAVNKTITISNRCYTIEQCHMILTNNDHYDHIINLKRNNYSSSLIFSSKFKILINYDRYNKKIFVSLISKNEIINTTSLSTKDCYRNKKELVKRNIPQQYRSDPSTSSVVITFNSSSFIDYRHRGILNFPLRLSVRFRTLGRISNGVLLSLTHRKSLTSIQPFIIIEHTNGKIEITILQVDKKNALSTVTSAQCGKNINNDNWHWLQFEIDQNGIFILNVDDDRRTSQVPSYVVSSWNINALLVGDTRRFNTDIFQPFIGYMSDLVFNDEYLFSSLTTRKEQIQPSSFHSHSQHITIGYRIAFFNLVTIDTQTSYIAFSERESQNKNHGKLDIYFLFRSYVPDGIILYRYAQGLNEYFAIGLRAGILVLFIDFGFGKRQIVSDESTKLSDGKWHEVRVTRLGTDKIELVVDNRVNRSTLSTNGIRNAVSLQPVLYVGGIPNSNTINLTGSGLNSYGFQGCLSSFIVDGRLLDYQTALVLHGKVKMNICSDLNKLCYDFTCLHSGICTSNENDGVKCECTETGYVGERCDKLPNGFYFGKHDSVGMLEYVMSSARQIEQDTITFGLQTSSTSAQIFRLESDSNIYSLEYEIVQGRSYIKLNLGEKQPDVYSAIAHVTDGVYHVIKIIRKLSVIDLYVDGVKIPLTGENKPIYSSDQRIYSTQRQITIGSFKNTSQWNGVIAGLSLNRQSIFDSLGNTLIRSGDVEEVYPNQYLGQFNLTNLSDILIFSTTTSLFTSNNTRSITSILNSTIDTSTIAIADYIHHAEPKTKVNIISPIPIEHRGTLIQWFSHQITRFGIRGLLIGSIIIACFLLFLLFIFIRLHCTNRSTRRKNLSYTYNETNGKTYSHLNQQNKRCSISSSSADRRDSKKHLPRFLRYLHTNETKPTSFRLSTNNNGGDNYRLISSINENKTIPYRNSDCVLNEHCCIHSSLSQPTSSSSTSMYHQVNHLMSSNNDLPLPIPLANHTQSSHSSNTTTTTTLRSLKKDADNSSAQTYSAVYSCDLAANLDIEQDLLQKRSSIKRRSILKNNQSSVIHTKMLFLYVKNLVDCYALQPNNNNNINNEPILLATANENRIQLSHALVTTANENRIQLSHALTGSFHSQLPISSVGSCHDILFSYDSQFLIGLFYEVSTNINPYAVKIWSTDNYTVRTSQHPIKCSVALTSRNSSILYMAGKQKYGRGISLGLLDINSCSLTRELKSDPDTSIGDEIRRIILTKNESYVLVVCTEHTSPYTCFVVFKLEPISIIDNEQILSTTTSESTSNCTMILTRFNCDPNNTFPINDSNNNDNEQILTILHTNQIIIWQLYDGEILVNYDFHHLNLDNKIQQIYSCQMNNNRLLIHMEQGIIHIWDVTPINGQFTLISTISDPLIHSISWLDQRHFLSVDKTGQRIRTWNIHRKDVINELISSLDSIQSLYVHLITNDLNKRQEYLIIGKSINDRNLLIFEYTQPHDESLTPSIS
ncbi:unnamed protein product [Adineta steineri]|uniref:Uncharacterized protein n=1 Tax=Adineta steineri TaxID=433720 RepID=A0A814BZU4_9BILA|nr:unnamed protein product [Adineta steineri]